MSHKLRRRFTKWYVERGYTVTSDMHKSTWNCPFWVRPLLIFFSPSIYLSEIFKKNWIEGFECGLRSTQSNTWKDCLLGGDIDGDELPKGGEK